MKLVAIIKPLVKILLERQQVWQGLGPSWLCGLVDRSIDGLLVRIFLVVLSPSAVGLTRPFNRMSNCGGNL